LTQLLVPCHVAHVDFGLPEAETLVPAMTEESCGPFPEEEAQYEFADIVQQIRSPYCPSNSDALERGRFEISREQTIARASLQWDLAPLARYGVRVSSVLSVFVDLMGSCDKFGIVFRVISQLAPGVLQIPNRPRIATDAIVDAENDGRFQAARNQLNRVTWAEPRRQNPIIRALTNVEFGTKRADP
tara:strand:+ start:83 stop:643 length:561 start_codon:yes stop_codon:yes gene_type:complete